MSHSILANKELLFVKIFFSILGVLLAFAILFTIAKGLWKIDDHSQKLAFDPQGNLTKKRWVGFDKGQYTTKWYTGAHPNPDYLDIGTIKVNEDGKYEYTKFAWISFDYFYFSQEEKDMLLRVAREDGYQAFMDAKETLVEEYYNPEEITKKVIEILSKPYETPTTTAVTPNYPYRSEIEDLIEDKMGLRIDHISIRYKTTPGLAGKQEGG